MHPVKIALNITYDGTTFDGWQDNKNNLSIEGLLKKAFYSLFDKEFLLDAASRTDKGVHALNQIVVTHYNLEKIPLCQLLKALNSKLPLSIRVKSITIVPEQFHPSLSVKKKHYLYQLDLHKVQLPFYQKTHWHIPQELDLDKMKKGAKLLIGTKDFSAFSNATKKESLNPICCVEQIIVTSIENKFLTIEIIGDRFLYKMCRIMVGTLVGVGKGFFKLDDIPTLFEHKKRVHAGITAPAHGLYLKNLKYSEYAILE